LAVPRLLRADGALARGAADRAAPSRGRADPPGTATLPGNPATLQPCLVLSPATTARDRMLCALVARGTFARRSRLPCNGRRGGAESVRAQVIARWVRQRHIMLNLLSSNEKTLRRSLPRARTRVILAAVPRRVRTDAMTGLWTRGSCTRQPRSRSSSCMSPLNPRARSDASVNAWRGAAHLTLWEFAFLCQ
jgi:hypothetical protein